MSERLLQLNIPRTNTIIANDVTRTIFRYLLLLPLMMAMIGKKFDMTFHINCSNHVVRNDVLDLVTIACNNDHVIEQQYRLINKYLADPFCYTVADNSSSTLKQQKILDFCRKSNIAYIRLPSNPLTLSMFSNYSHGMACNWVYYNYIKPRAAPYFGLLDHDIFPVKKTSIINILKNQPIFGFGAQNRAAGNVWWLLVGFSFFRRDYIVGKVIDFTPDKGWDTGYSNWNSIYSKIDRATLEFPIVSTCGWRDRDGNDVQASRYQTVGDWIHTVNASYWVKEPSKEDLIEILLAQY